MMDRMTEHDGFSGAPRPWGRQGLGRGMLSFLPGQVIGNQRPWPAWAHSDDALVQVAGVVTQHLLPPTVPGGSMW